MTAWRKSQSGSEPAVIDTTTSKLVVYERRNITHEEETDETGETRTVWKYEEREIPVEEYAQLSSPAVQLIMQELSNLELAIAQQGS